MSQRPYSFVPTAVVSGYYHGAAAKLNPPSM
jgi:hypothetical protein